EGSVRVHLLQKALPSRPKQPDLLPNICAAQRCLEPRLSPGARQTPSSSFPGRAGDTPKHLCTRLLCSGIRQTERG
ncbi:unnamed protein product, partial [Bubo scandiacus]